MFVLPMDPPRQGRRRERRDAVPDPLEVWVSRVYRFAVRLCGDRHAADDVTQETFLRAWPRRKKLRDESAMRAWLFRIAVNVWRDRCRRNQSPIAQARPADQELISMMPWPDRLAEHQEELVLALQAMDRLPDRQREVLYLCACESMTPTEAAEILGTTPEAAKASLSVARKKVREWMGEVR